jgi:hypothetical protein
MLQETTINLTETCKNVLNNLAFFFVQNGRKKETHVLILSFDVQLSVNTSIQTFREFMSSTDYIVIWGMEDAAISRF